MNLPWSAKRLLVFVLVASCFIKEVKAQPIPQAELKVLFQDTQREVKDFKTNSFEYVNRFRVTLANESVKKYGFNLISDMEVWTGPTLINHTLIYIDDAVRGKNMGDEDRHNLFLACVGLGSSNEWGGSGVLIASNLILTAAHCIDFGFTNFVAFGYDLNVRTQRAVYYTGSYLRHPQYNPATYENDLAVIWLKSDVRGVAIPGRATSADILKSTNLVAAGYGSVDRQAQTPTGTRRWARIILESYTCDDLEERLRLSYQCHPNEMVGKRGLVDTCTGDSGGPLFINLGTESVPKWAIAAVTSRGTESRSAPCGDGGIYRRIDGETQFLNSLTNAHWPK